MYVTFKNDSNTTKSIITIENQRFVINPHESVKVFCSSTNPEFFAESCAVQELSEAVSEIDEKSNNARLKDKILTRLAKKAAEKISDVVLNSVIKYSLYSSDISDITVTLTDGVYSLFSGKLAEFLDMMPVAYVFLRAETENADISVADVKILNRKKYLRLIRKILLFMHAGFTSINLLFFLPEYLIIKLFSSAFFVRLLLSSLYKKSSQDRGRILEKNERRYEAESEKSGCFASILKLVILLSIFLGICIHSMFTDPDVLISEDFSFVVYYEETFVKYEGGLPADAKKVFLEESIAYYPLDDGEFDMSNYYCTVYESVDGTRYLWLQDDCADPESADKEYDDYENPLVYKSTGALE